MSDENEDEKQQGKFGDRLRRVKTKAQEAAQRAAEQASRAADAVGDAAGKSGEKIKQGGTAAAENARDLSGRAAENARDLSGRAADNASDLKEAAMEKARAILESLNQAGSSVSESSRDASTKLSEEAQLALDVIRARFPELSDNLDDQVEIVALMNPQTHRQLVFAAGMFASKWIPVLGAHFVAGKLLRRLSKYVDEHKGDAPRKQGGMLLSSVRWVKEYNHAKQLWEKQRGVDGGGRGLAA